MPLISYFPSAGGGNIDYSSYFGTGEDGDLTVSSDVALPVALDSGQIIKQYNNLTVTSTGVLHPANRCNGMILLVKGDLTVDGTIHVDKCAPLLNDNEELAAQEQHIVLCGVTAGGKGGDGGTPVNATPYKNNSSKGTGGQGFQFGGGYAGGGGSVGFSYVTNAGSCTERPPAGTTIPYDGNNEDSKYGIGGSANSGAGYTFYGGDGPGGGGAEGVMSGKNGNNGDAIGGGALWIFVGGKVRINSTAAIRAKGGNGGAGVGSYSGATMYAYSGSGGGGGGGIVCIVHTGDIVNQGDVSALGGTSPTPSGTNGANAKGQDGSSGTVLITNIADLLGEGEWEPEWVTCTLENAFPPALSLVINVDGVPTLANYTVGTVPSGHTTLQVLKNSIWAIRIKGSIVYGGVLLVRESTLDVYVATEDFTIAG